MATGFWGLVLPDQQRRTLDDLTDDLDLRSGDRRSKQTAFWIMLVLSAVIASTGVMTDSTATVIGAMIIAPLSTPIMGIALGIARQERLGSVLFVVGGVLVVVLVGVAFAQLMPDGYDLLSNSQIAGRTSPGLFDMIAAMATGFAGAIALARKDVAAVLPGVAIAISLVPPLAVSGVCLGAGSLGLAFGAFLLFFSNLLALVFAGSLVFAYLSFAFERAPGQRRSKAKARVLLVVLLVLVFVPMAGNTASTYLIYHYSSTLHELADAWIADVPGAAVTGVDSQGLTWTVHVRTQGKLPPVEDLLETVQEQLPSFIGVTIEATPGTLIEARPPAV